jgi:glycosyltransferase involved in cell wall biosynthesis
MNSRVRDLMKEAARLLWINPVAGSDIAGIGTFQFHKIFRGMSAIMLYSFRSLVHYRRHTTYISLATDGFAFYRDLIIWTVAVVTSRRVIVHLHTASIDIIGPTTPISRLTEALLSRTEVWTLAETFRNAVEGLSPKRVEIVPNGVDCTEHQGSLISQVRSRHSEFRVIFLGNHFRVKGVDIAVEIANRMCQTTISWTFAGAAVDDSVEALIEKLQDVNPNVHRIVSLDATSKCELLRRADCLLMPSRYAHEAAPLVVLEAMSHGVVPVTSRQGAMPEMVGDAGFVCDSIGDYVNALTKLALDRVELERLSGLSIERWECKYSAVVFEKRVRQVLASP